MGEWRAGGSATGHHATMRHGPWCEIDTTSLVFFPQEFPGWVALREFRVCEAVAPFDPVVRHEPVEPAAGALL